MSFIKKNNGKVRGGEDLLEWNLAKLVSHGDNIEISFQMLLS